EFPLRRLCADLVACNAALSAAEKGGRWRPALVLFSALDGRSVTPDVITYSSVMRACGRC
ncbi:unnamed protein product, partial [Symbiodinium necroappetens]